MKRELLADWCIRTQNKIIPIEWNYDKNEDIDFQKVSSQSAQSVWWKCSVCGYEWNARIGNRTANNSGCPACANQAVWKGHNDLATTHPELICEWDYEKNSGISPYDVVAGSNKKVWWKCQKCGNEWKAIVYSRAKGIGCPVCSGNTVLIGINDLESQNPSLTEEWDYNQNMGLLPSEVTCNSGKRVWWKCSKCGYRWKAEIKARNNGTGCPACANKAVWKGHNDLATTHPELICEWDFEKNNGVSPYDVVAGSHKSVWWKCQKCGNEWKATIKSRSEGTRCRKCASKTVRQTYRTRRFAKEAYSNATSLLSVFPDLLKEWDYVKNTIVPEATAPFSGQKAWWKCSTCGYEWETPISSRTRGIGCPVCANKKVWKGHNDLATTNPELALEWDYDKNGSLKPSDFTVGSGVSVWWKCQKCGNEWETPINNRKGKPCAKCNALVGTSESEQFVFFYVKKAFKKAINRFKASWLKPYAEIDIFIPEINVAIEYDGQKWHSCIEKDEDKNRTIRNHGIDIIRFREEMCPPLTDGCYVIPVKRCDDASLALGIKKLFDYLNNHYNASIEMTIDFEKDRLEVLSLYRKSIGENSLYYSVNSIIDEWNYEKNGGLNPTDFTCHSHTKVWWKCSTCGYEYLSSISTRFQSKKGICPLCCGKVVVRGINDFASQRPELLKEWDYEKNGDILPTMVTAKSGKKVWWKCPTCNKSWLAAVHDRNSPCKHKK